MNSETNSPLEIIRCRVAGAVHWVEFTAGETIEAGDLLMYKGGLCFRAIPAKRVLRKRLSRRRGTWWYRHRDAWKLELKKLGWWEPSPNDPTLTDGELEIAFYRAAEKVLFGECECTT